LISHLQSESNVPLYLPKVSFTSREFWGYFNTKQALPGLRRLALPSRVKLKSEIITGDRPYPTMSEHKQDDSFRVIDRRPFTSEGELRKDVVEEQEREAKVEAAKAPPSRAEKAKAPANAPAADADAPKRLPAFENLVRMLGQNAAMVLGGYADPRTGQPMIDPDAARELIDMLDSLHEKTKGNLAPEEDDLLLDLLGKLKMTYLEINQAVAAQAATQAKAKTR
jgi:Domain of unknown function (DUF1844)